MIVDIHTHISDLRSPGSMDRMPLSVDALLQRLDDEGIDQAVVLPWPACPEAVTLPALFLPNPDIVSQLRLASAHPDRLILFGNLDPRWAGNSPNADFTPLLERFIEMGCRGIGELAAGIPIDDPRVVNVFRQCGAMGLPVLIETAGPGLGRYGLIDEAHAPRLERVLGLVPEVIIIGHGPGFWAEIGEGLTDEAKSGYPSEPIGAGGALWRLMRTYPNLYADISAGSGWNALTRDPAPGLAFVREFIHRLCFGTDTCFADERGRMPQLRWLRDLRTSGQITQEEFDAISGGNTLRLLR